MAGGDRRGRRAPAALHGEQAVHRAADILNTRFNGELSVPDLADEVAMTQNYLARRFKRRFGMTIPRYLLTVRMQHAQLLLSTTNLPIGRIAHRVGMPDRQHFNKQFRRSAGASPSAFRSRARPRDVKGTFMIYASALA